MRALILRVTIVLLLLLFACASGKPQKESPRHISSGAREMQKGLAWYEKGCYEKSLEYLFRAYDLYSAADVLDGVAMSLNNIGTIFRIMGKYEKAISFLDESYAIYSELNNQEGALRALSNKSAALIDAGALDKAEQLLQSAIQHLPSAENNRLLAPLLQNRGVLLTKKGSFDAAEEVLIKCLNQADSLDPPGMASLHFAYGNLMLKTDRPSEAIASFEKALSIDRKLGFYNGMADDLFSMGEAYLNLGEEEKAVAVWKRSAKIYALIDHASELEKTMKHLRETAQRAGADISVTESFVERWREGRLHESPCDNSVVSHR
jgi:tetratricopeptide (TPR) repeat protein